MIDTLALVLSHGMLALVILRLLKVRDPEGPPPKASAKRGPPPRPGARPRA